MSGRACEGCRWFVRNDGKNSGECRRYPLPHGKNAGWPRTAVWEGCGEWADASITAEEAERRELVRQFALAIVASDAAGDSMVHRVWQRAAELADYEGQV